ncbi:MAG: EthD family reductase [Planctomycetota bacterium]|nr:MAG: EthD family reductase [Planctomycetota bacterium]
MVKLVALYKKPADMEAFERHYREIHTPLAKKIPGLMKLEVSRVFGAPAGEPKFYLMAELYFENRDAMMAGLNSEEGKAAAKDVVGFAGDLIHMMFAEVE